VKRDLGWPKFWRKLGSNFDRMGQMEMKCIFDLEKKYLYMGLGFSGERCGPWASCFGVSFLLNRR
jgi:hypothetical protein